MNQDVTAASRNDDIAAPLPSVEGGVPAVGPSQFESWLLAILSQGAECYLYEESVWCSESDCFHPKAEYIWFGHRSDMIALHAPGLAEWWRNHPARTQDASSTATPQGVGTESESPVPSTEPPVSLQGEEK